MARKNTNQSKRASGSGHAASSVAAVKGGLLLSSGWGRWLVVTLALMVALAFLYPGPMFQGQVFQSADSGNADSFAVVGDASLAAGHYPLWNPYLFAGMPTFGSLAYAKYLYPPSVVFNFLQGKLGFVPLTWLLAHLLFGGLGMAWLLSRWKLPLGALVLGAVVWLLFPRIVAWGVYGHGTKLGAAMYLPWIVGWALRVLDGPVDIRRNIRLDIKKWRAIGMVGLLLGLQILRGHPQITYYTLLVVGWLGLLGTIFPFDEQARQVAAAVRWRRFGLLASALALGFLVGSIYLLPGHDYAAISIRGQDTLGGGGVGLDYATGWSLSPRELSTFVLPAAAGFGKATYMGMMPFTDYPNYFGFLLLLLAAAAWWKGPRSIFLAFGVLALLAVLVSFGNFGFGLYELLYNYLPFFNKFRIPSMILVLVAFALAVLAARGVTAWTESLQADPKEPRTFPLGRPYVLPAILAGLGVLLLVAGATGAVRESFITSLQGLAAQSGKQAAEVLLKEAWFLQKSSLVRIGLVLMTAGAALWASVKNRHFIGSQVPWILAVLLVMDLGGVNRLIVHPEQGLQTVAQDAQGRGVLVKSGPLLRLPAQAAAETAGPQAQVLAGAVGHDRVWPLGSLGVSNLWMGDGIRSLGGYHPAKLASFEKIRARLNSQQPAGRLANWLGGRVIAFERPLSPADLDFLDSTGTDLEPDPVQARSPYFYNNLAALPRARLLTSWQPVSSLPEKDALVPFLDGIQDGTIDYRNTVYLDQTPVPVPVTGPQALPVPVFVTDGLDEIILNVDTPTAALLLLADMNAPGWRVTVDEVEKPFLVADLVLRAVALEAGSHTVRFHYGDPAVGRGLTLTAAGGIIVLLLLLLPLALDRRATSIQGSSGDE